MNLYRLGNKVFNMDRLNGILDHLGPASPEGPANQRVLRLLFDQTQLDLTGRDAQTVRQWYRHAARNLDPQKDEDGEELISPHDQVRRAVEILVAMIERLRPRDTLMRQTSHRLGEMIDQYLTGELPPMRTRAFEKSFEEALVEP